MHVRPIKCKKSSFKFFLGEKPINYCSTYTYLGTLVHEFLNFNKSAEALYDPASRALGAIICKMKKCGGFPINTYKIVVDSCVFSITDYGKEVYGYNPHPPTEALHMRVLRSFLGLKKTTPSEGIKAEFKWLSPQSRGQIKMVRQFFRMRNLSDSRITKKILNYDIKLSNFGREDCWSSEVNNILNKNNLGHYFSEPCNAKDVIKSLSDSLLQNDIQNYFKNCISYSKLSHYINICDQTSDTVYLYKPLNLTQKRNLARFRLGTLPLRAETANYLPRPVPVSAKICLNCTSNTIEDTIHLLYCTKHEQLRKQLYLKIGIPPAHLSDYDILKIMSNHPDIVKLFAQFITDCYNNRQHK